MLADLNQHHLIGGPIDGGDQNWRALRQGATELQPVDPRVRNRSALGAALDAASDDQRSLSGANGPGRAANRIEARTAETVDRYARYADGQAGQQRRHARDVAIVLACLIGAAVDNVIELRPIDGRISPDQS